ncbi:MAG: helix-turn-helix domain-containing protein [Bacteroidales bacterium]|nr:helix-turn-helix domain-containing protein [Bacteroidales bacterium]
MNKKLRERQAKKAIELRSLGLPLRSISKKIGLSKSTVWRMLRTFDPENGYGVEDMEEKDRSDKSKSREQQLVEEIARLKAELKETRKELDLQNLRADVLDEMINIAERKFEIKIRKKSGVKR